MLLIRRSCVSLLLVGVLSSAKPMAAGEPPGSVDQAQREAGVSWAGTDIGEPVGVGTHEIQGETVAIRGAGRGATSGKDQLHFVAVPVTGDVEIIARLAAFDGGPHAQAGIMLRTNDTPDAPMASVLFACQETKAKDTDVWHHVVRQVARDPAALYRRHTDGAATHLAPPLWLKLTRIGNDYAVARSRDGVTWVMVNNNSGGSLHGDGKLRAGLFVSSGDPQKLATATFDHISIAPPRRNLRTGWIGTTFAQDSTGYVSGHIGALYVAPDGTCYTNTYWDEAGEAAKIYKDGKVVRAFASPLGGNNFCYEGSVTGDGTHVYIYCRQDAAIHRASRAGTDEGKFAFADSLANTAKKNEATLRGMAVGNGELYISDAAQNRILVADLATRQQLQERSFAFTRPGPIAVDKRGDLWIIQCARDYPPDGKNDNRYPAAIKCYTRNGQFTNRQISDVAVPHALAYDGPRDRLLVCEDGPDQNLRIYTGLADEPRCTATFGVKGGVYSGTRLGLLRDEAAGGDRRFYQPRGVGVDEEGNIYVACAGVGADLRKYAPDGALCWQLKAIHFTDCPDFDPDSDGRELYAPFKHETLDFAQTSPGSEWRFTGVSWNPQKYGPKPRGASTAVVRRLGPERALIMFTSGQGTAPPLLMFRYEGEIAMPCGRLTQRKENPRECELWLDSNGDGRETPDEVTAVPPPERQSFQSFDVDAHGNIWTAWLAGEKPTLRHFRFKGLDARGAPRYGLAAEDFEDIAFPAPIIGSRHGQVRVRYDAAADAMYLMGPAKKRTKDAGENTILQLARYDRWREGNRDARWAITLPDPDSDPDFIHTVRPFPFGMDFSWMAFDVAGEKVFVAELWGPIHVFDAATGHRVTILNPGPELSGMTAWQDANLGIRACRRKGGEYVILRENSGYRGLVHLYRWQPE